MTNELNEIDYRKNMFDIIRLLAAFQVVFTHCINHFELSNNLILSKISNLSYYIPGGGVITLFFLSGFFSLQSVSKERKFGDYVKKKINRLYPELWMSFFLGVIFILLTYNFSTKIIDWMVYISTQLTIFQFYTGDWLRGYGVGCPNGSLWTITVIVQFYFVVYLFNRVIHKKTTWIVLYIIFAVISFLALKLNILSNGELMSAKLFAVSLIPYFHIFLLGVILWNYRNILIPICKKIWMIILILYIGIKYIGIEVFHTNFGYRYDVFSTMIYCFLLLGVGYLCNLRLKIEISYSIYLYHMLFVNLLIQICRNGGRVIQDYGITFLIFTFMLTIVISIISTLSIKKIKLFK